MDKTKFINIIVGDIDVPEKTYLIECCVTETVNQSIICMKTDDILRKLDTARELSSVAFGCGQLYDGLHSDAKGTLPALVSCHMSCAHAAQLCEKVRSVFADVDDLVARVKTATIKNKSRQAQFKHIGSPPELVVTRWGT